MSITATAEQAVADYGLEGELTAIAATCPRTALEIGVFFDGTWNNHVNAEIGGGEGSYAPNSGPTNVFHLSELYKKGRDFDIQNEDGAGLCRKFTSEYVPGIGTRTEGPDDPFGAGVGMGETGVEATVIATCLRIGDIIDELSPGVEPDEIILDVFGFSRGAAAARYFVNAFRQGWIEYNSGMPVFGEVIRARVPPGRNIKVRFLGIFDTVASIGLSVARFNWGVNIDLDEAKQVEKAIYHVTADNEYRINFPLSESIPGGGVQVGMPGAHGDIGGSYTQPGDRAIIDAESTIAYTRRDVAQAALDRIHSTAASRIDDAWVEEGWIHEHERATAVQVEATAIRETRTPGYMGMPATAHEFSYATVLNRPWVRLGLGQVAMAAMHYNAKQFSEVPFVDLPDRDTYRVPGQLRNLFHSVVAGLPAEAALGRDAIRTIIHDFAHVSSEPWSVVNAGNPFRWRQRFANRPGRAS